MAGFQLSDTPVDTRSAEFVTGGVKDTTQAEAIQTLGTMAGEAYMGKQAADIETEVEQQVFSYFEKAGMEGLESPIHERQLIKAQESAAREEVDVLGNPTPAEQKELNNARKEVTKLKNVAAQGAISDTELQARVEAITKKYINKLPGLTKEFQSYAATALGKYESNIDYIEAQRRARLTASEKNNAYKNKIMGLAVEMGTSAIFNQDGSRKSFDETEAVVLGRQHNKEQVRLIEQSAQKNDVLNSEALNKMGATWAQEHTMLQSSAFERLLEGKDAEGQPLINNPIELEKMLTAEYTARQQDMLRGVRAANRENPTVKAALAAMKTQYEMVVAEVTGTKNAAVLKNLVDANNAQLQLDIMNTADGRYVKTIRTMMGDNVVTDLILGEKIKAEDFINNVQAVADGVYVIPAPTSVRKGREQNAQAIFRGVSALVGDSVSKNDAQSITDAANSITTIVNGWHEGETATMRDRLVGLAADPNFSEFSQHLDADTKTKMSSHIRDYIFNHINPNAIETFDSSTMAVVVDAQGNISAQPKVRDPDVLRATSEINRTLMPRYSNYIRAEGNLQGRKDYAASAAKVAEIMNALPPKQTKAIEEDTGREITFLPVPRGEEGEKIQADDWLAEKLFNFWTAPGQYVIPKIKSTLQQVVEGPQGE